MKRIVSLISAVLIMLVGFAVPVKAESIFDTAQSIKLEKTYSTAISDSNLIRDYKFKVTKQGKLSFSLTLSDWESRDYYYCDVTLYDEYGNEVAIVSNNVTTGAWNKDDNGTQAACNEVSHMFKGSLSANVKKGTYYLRFSHRTAFKNPMGYDSGRGNIQFKLSMKGNNSSSKSSSGSYLAIYMNKGDSIDLGAVVSGKATSNVNLSTSNNKVAKYDSDGVVTAVGNGTAIITVKSGSASINLCVVVQ